MSGKLCDGFVYTENHTAEPKRENAQVKGKEGGISLLRPLRIH